MYLEANGTFKLVENEVPNPGLSILPEWDGEFRKRACKESKELVCNHCGNAKTNNSQVCGRCGRQDWVTAVE